MGRRSGKAARKRYLKKQKIKKRKFKKIKLNAEANAALKDTFEMKIKNLTPKKADEKIGMN